MKRPARKRSKPKTEPTRDQFLAHVGFLIEEHLGAWEAELFRQAPRWPVLLGLHLRLAELEHLEGAVEELL